MSVIGRHNIFASRTRRTPVGEWWRSVDQIQLGLLIVLIGAGLILSMAASPAATTRLDYDNPFFFLYRHGVFATLGLGGAIFISFLGPTWARRLGIVSLFGAIALMAMLPFIGYEVKGAVRWIRLGAFSLQPSEFAKPAFVVFAAWMFSVRKRDANVPSVAIVFTVFALIIGLLITQPDFGQSFLLTLGFAAVFFFAVFNLGRLDYPFGELCVPSLP